MTGILKTPDRRPYSATPAAFVTHLLSPILPFGWEHCIASDPHAKFTLFKNALASMRSLQNGCGGEDWRR
jgi:hypothetical protein